MKDVTAAIIIQDDKILITRRAPGQNLAGKWEFPGGKIEPGETPEICLARELEEELAITVLVGERFGESIYEYDRGTIRLLAYRAEILGGDIALSVHDSYSWESFSDLDRYDFAPADIPLVRKLQEM